MLHPLISIHQKTTMKKPKTVPVEAEFNSSDNQWELGIKNYEGKTILSKYNYLNFMVNFQVLTLTCRLFVVVPILFFCFLYIFLNW